MPASSISSTSRRCAPWRASVSRCGARSSRRPSSRRALVSVEERVDVVLGDVADVIGEPRPVEEGALPGGALVPLLSGELLEGIEAAPDPDHPVQPLLDELQHADDLGDALAGEVLEIARLVESDGAVEDRADAVVVPGLDAGGAKHGRVRLDLLGGGKNRRRRILGRLDDGVELAGYPAHAS